ncbi:MAG TPA: ATP-binding protein, partial [Puia sp.]|nr:ATP-binding protein [Puia sp.]
TYYGGLDCFDGQGFRHYRHNESDSNSLADDRIWEIHEDSRHRLWIGTLASGLDRFDREKNIFIHYRPGAPNSVVSGFISELQEDGQGNLWVGTAYGIDVLDGVTGLFRHYGNQPGDASSLSNNNVISIIEDSRGLIWVGTREGLDLLDRRRQTFTTFRTSDGLPDNAILTILEDNDHNLWLGTPSGLCNVIITPDPKGIDGYAFRYRNFDESHGLQGREFNENAALKTHSGELIFGGAGGYNRFDPQKLRSVARNPILVLTDLQLFNKTVGIGETFNGHIPLPQSITESRNITLRYNENVFSLGFAVLDLLNAEKVKYAYQLEGFNNEWLVSNDKTRKAVFTNLDPGHYIFRVRTAKEEGGWNEPTLQVGITILPPFWKTPLAYACYVLLLAGVLFLARRMVVQRAHMRFALEQERKEAHRLHELDRMKTRFFTNVSHEFRTPLSLILTPLDKIIRQTQDPGQQHQLNLIHRNARRLLNMVNQLLDFRKLEMQELRLNPNPGDIVRLIKELSFSFTDMAGKKNIEFFFQSTLQSLEMSFDQDKLERILFNLLSNAFKFTPEHGRIEVNLEMEGLWLHLSVRDTGIGIDKDKQEKIFERFFQSDIPGSMLNMGSGIGLAITREFVRLHGGTIRVSSEPGQGSCFTVLFPVPEKSEPVYMSSLIHDGGNDQLMIGPAVAGRPLKEETPDAVDSDRSLREGPAGPHTYKRPIVLLVEDNEDFRFYLKDNLKDTFIILEAADGKEGWHRALGDHPDLIVSDISKPVMNGIDLCRKIKDDRRTSLIPVILLTALIGEEQQLRGLKTGANDYMTKPFNFEILVSKIQNLLQQQATARKTWQRQVQALPTATAVESPDEKFIRQALELVEKNMANPDFSVEEMSRVLYLSRVALYKKILSLTGRTPIEFIRSIRLKRAAQLLEKSKFTIAEIAYEVGFNNPKYFSRYFKEEFGILPSAYQRSPRHE